MDPNSGPSNVECADDLPGSRPGGVDPVEEHAGPNDLPPPSPTSDEDMIEDPAFPAAPPGTLFAELPEGWRPGGFDALFDRLNDHPDGFAAAAMIVDVGAEAALAFYPEEAYVPDMNHMMALIRQMERMPQGQLQRTPPWEQVLQPLNPELQAFFRTFADRVRSLAEDFDENADPPSPSPEEFHALWDEFVQARTAAATLDDFTHLHLTRYFDDAHDEIQRIEDIVMARLASAGILDSLTCTNAEFLSSDDLRCCICMEGYAAVENVVVLPCHDSHHFHRACIQRWLDELIPEPLSCPICRRDVHSAGSPVEADPPGEYDAPDE